MEMPGAGIGGASLATTRDRMTTAEVISLIRKASQPVGVEKACLDDAFHRVLREDVLAPEDQPVFDRSAVDGFAVRLDDSSKSFNIVETIRAGEWKPRVLARGEAVRIATGGALPSPGLRVIMREQVIAENGRMSVKDCGNETHVRYRGEDAKAGSILVQQGTLLKAGSLALLASVGHTQPLVSRRIQVAHIATGNEIVPPETTPRPGQIRDSNSTLVRAFFCPWPCVLAQFRAPEEKAQAAKIFAAAQENAGLLLISGGASVGEHDFTRALLEEAGFSILLSRTSTRPGKPLIIAHRGASLAFGLPGNPLAHFVCLNLFVRTALGAMSGSEASPPLNHATLCAELDNGGNPRETLWPAEQLRAEESALLRPLGWSSSGDLTCLSRANALIRIPPGANKLMKGQQVEFFEIKEGP